MAEGQATRLCALALLALSLWGAWQGATLAQRDFAFEAARTEVSFWGRDNYQPTESTIERTGNTLSNVIAQNPHPEYLSVQAAYYTWRAYWEGSNELAVAAVNSQQKALESRPAHPQDAKKLVEYQRRVRPAHQDTPGQ